MIEIGINRDKALNALSDFSARLYFMVLPHTDNFGRYEGDAELIRACCLPLTKRPVKKIEEAICEISESELWTRYKTKKGKLVIQYNEESFDRINKFLVKNREMPEYPPYEAGDEYIGRSIIEKPDAKKPEEKIIEEKKFYGKYVQLTESEHKRLIEERGEVFIQEVIEYLNLYFEEKPAYLDKVSSHNAVIRRWGIQAIDERHQKRSGNNTQWKYNNKPVQREEECEYCHKKFSNLTTHQYHCESAPPLPSTERVHEIIESSRKLTEHFTLPQTKKK
ncbi:MAG: hypothetical protein IMZ53_12810 [Thermoplasmata archaeon]|nr:hypothetical protein [Thermoplasmata archaeon]